MSFLIKQSVVSRIVVNDVSRKVTNHPFILMSIYVGSLLIAATVLASIESWRWIDSLWWAQVASLTIGYGDIAPKTDIGRLVAMLFQWFWALYIILCIAAHLVKYMFRDKNEMTHDEQEWLFNGSEVDSARILWLVESQEHMIRAFGIQMRPAPHRGEDGTHITRPAQPADTSYGDISTPPSDVSAARSQQ